MARRNTRLVTLYRPGEKRRADRIRTLMPCALIPSGAASPIPGVLRNLSASGAKVHVEDGRRVPDEFELRLEGAQIFARARVVWRRGGYIGVAFVGAARADAAVLRI